MKLLARELFDVHSLLPVPVHHKEPLGGTGWNLLAIADRLLLLDAAMCTGIGIQGGLLMHPYHGWCEARIVDCDIDNPQQQAAFATTFESMIGHRLPWRWGRRPACIVFTRPGVLRREKYGPVQLLGPGKQAVWWGRYQNKAPLPTDPPEYCHPDGDLMKLMPPLIEPATLESAILSGLATAGIVIPVRAEIAAPSEDDLDALAPDDIARYHADVARAVGTVQTMPVGSGRGSIMHDLGLRYGALIKAGKLADVSAELPPEVLRDFSRGVDASKGLALAATIGRNKHPLLMPTGRDFIGQSDSDLMRENLPPLQYLINRFLSDTGCIVLAGKPKVGKGWIILEMALAVAEGSTFWGEDCEQGEVLLYMLEDSKRRVKERLAIMRPNGRTPDRKLMRFRYSADGPFFVNSDGTGSLLEDISKHLHDCPGIKLIIVDVLQRVRGTVDRSDNAYQVDYKVIASLQKLASDKAILIVVVHHTKKGKVDDAIDSINGSFGVIGAADGGIIIGKEGDVMRAQSMMRDIPDYEFDLVKKEGSPMWVPAETANDRSIPEGSKTSSVWHALHVAACELTAPDIAKRLGISDANVTTYLTRLARTGQVTKTSRGFYMAAGLPTRERAEGIKDALRRCELHPVTAELETKYTGTKGAPEGAEYMVLTDKAIAEIETTFSAGKKALDALQHRGVLKYNSDTVWLIGPEWKLPQRQTQHANPFALKMPWELQT